MLNLGSDSGRKIACAIGCRIRRYCRAADLFGLSVKKRRRSAPSRSSAAGIRRSLGYFAQVLLLSFPVLASAGAASVKVAVVQLSSSDVGNFEQIRPLPGRQKLRGLSW